MFICTSSPLLRLAICQALKLLSARWTQGLLMLLIASLLNFTAPLSFSSELGDAASHNSENSTRTSVIRYSTSTPDYSKISAIKDSALRLSDIVSSTNGFFINSAFVVRGAGDINNDSINDLLIYNPAFIIPEVQI